MRFLLSWIKEFIELSVPPERLAERLTLGGLEVNRLEKIEGDWLFEAEVTPNRSDLLSHLGLARETAAVLGRPFHFPRWLSREFRMPRAEKEAAFPVSIEEPEGCKRYVGIVIEGVQVCPSPPVLAKRLEKMGLRPVNNVVDVTNLCMLELGQPMHAFDLDRLEGSQIRVRRAAPGETLHLLDGTRLTLTSDQLVIADGKKPAALAGVMGGQASQITEKTTRILLESAWFRPSWIRRSCRLSKISSDSSYRFERGIDPGMVLPAAVRAARWIVRLAGGTIRGPVNDVGQAPPVRRGIPLKPKKAQELLGMKISSGQQRRLLEHAGCQVRVGGRGWTVLPPSWRTDLEIPEDLYEELARLFGYDRCAPTLPPLPRRAGEAAALLEDDPSLEMERRIRNLLTGAGMQEILSYSLLHPQEHERVKTMTGRGVAELQNPLSLEQAVMRNTLLVGALQAVARNLNWKTAEGFQLFEIGSVFGKNPDGSPKEMKALSMIAGGATASAWGVPKQALGLFHLKGALRLLSERMKFKLEENPGTLAGPFIDSGLRLGIGGKPAGRVGRLDPAVAASYGIPDQVPLAYAELELEPLFSVLGEWPRLKPLAKVPPVQRDLAVVIPEQTPYEKLQSTIEQEGRPLLEEVALFDFYQGKQIADGKKSLAFRLWFSDGDRTLTEAEIQAVHKKIVDRLQKEFSATLRE